MRTFRLRGTAVLAAVFAVAMVACSNDTTTTGAGGGSTSSSAGTGVCATVDTSTNDALSRICKSGELRVATDQKYKPQSWYDVKSGEWKGFDVDVAKEIAARLGVDADINHQDWSVITAGSWNDRWDVSVGSMTDTIPREKLFSFTPPYYYTTAGVAVNSSNTSIQNLETDLDGKKVCVGVDTTYQDYLKKTLDISATNAPKYEFLVDNASIVTFPTDTDALDELALGDGVRCDAAITAVPTIQAFVDAGGPVKVVGDPVFFEPLCVAFDKADPVDNTALVDAVSTIIKDMHEDGTLTSLSMDWYKADLTTVSGT
jgi:polar amino acid transport system substrate-binding protein